MAVSTTRSDGEGPAVVVLALLNTQPFSSYPDRLADPAHADELVEAMGFEAGSVPVGPHTQLRKIRDVLDRLIRGDESETELWSAFSDLVSSVRWSYEFSDGNVRPREIGTDTIMGRLVTAVAELVRHGTWARLRICSNEECGVAFYDFTRSRTQRWHSYEMCGNRVNVAALRARKGAVDDTHT